MQKLKTLAVLVTVFLCSALWSQAAPPAGRLAPTPAAQSIDNSHYINANNLLGFVTNRGSDFRDLSGVFGHDYGFFYPYTSIEDILNGTHTTSAIYAAGLWIGGMVGGEVRVAVAEYTTEFAPGPMKDGTFQTDDPAFRVYQIYDDSLESNPNTDYVSWPVAQGAPLDGAGHPLSMGKQTLWTVYNDADPALHNNRTGSTLPLGVEVQQNVYASDGPYYEDNAVYLQYKLYNRGSNVINDCYISFWLDPDLGDASDDLVGCDTTTDVFFCYNAQPQDNQYGPNPPAVGIRILNGPVVPSPGDSAVFDGHKLVDYRNLHMTAFGEYLNGTDPGNFQQTYNVMQGLLRDGNPYYFDGQELKFMRSGDPIVGTGDLEYIGYDRRMMASFGPLTFSPGDSQQVLLKVAVGQGADRLTSLNVLKYNLQSEPAVQCGSANLNVSDYGRLTQAGFFPKSDRWLEGMNWGGAVFNGGIDYGIDFFGSALDPGPMPDSFVNVDIRFSTTAKQFAYRYVRPDFTYGGYYEVPFTVWDTDHDRQLNAAFVEWTNSRILDSTWNLDDSAHYGGREYLVIFKSDYSGADPLIAPLHYPLRNLRNDAGGLDILYVGWFCLAPGHGMEDLASGQTLSIRVQRKMLNGTGNLVLFRDTRPGDTAIQYIGVGCESAYLPEATLVFEDTTLFNGLSGPPEWYVRPSARITQVREMSNGDGLVEPPDGRNVYASPNSTGDWSVSPAHTLRSDTLSNFSTDDWEVRFTAGGSWGYDYYADTLFGYVPLEVWNIGDESFADASDDFRLAVWVIDVDLNGVWNLGDYCFFTEAPYVDSPLPTQDPQWDMLGRVRLRFINLSGLIPIPEQGTVVRAVSEKLFLAPGLNTLAVDPELPVSPGVIHQTMQPDGYDLGYTLQFTPKHYGDYIDAMEIRDSLGGGLLASISLIGSTTESCCTGTTGNVNESISETPDLSDLSLLISYFTATSRPTLPCPEEANMNGVGSIDLSDLSLCIAYLTQDPRPALPNCP